MIDTIIQMVVDVLSILGIATKEINQGRMSGQFSMSMSPLTERCFRRIWEEAIAENMRVTHAVRDEVLAVDNRVASVDNKIADVFDSARIIDQVKCSSSLNFVVTEYGALPALPVTQKTSCGRTSTNDSLHWIRQLTITLHVVLITKKQQVGSFKEASSGNENQDVIRGIS
jgi:hypothetical protein